MMTTTTYLDNLRMTWRRTVGDVGYATNLLRTIEAIHDSRIAKERKRNLGNGRGLSQRMGVVQRVCRQEVG